MKVLERNVTYGPFLERLRSAPARVLLLDYDGTLAPPLWSTALLRLALSRSTAPDREDHGARHQGGADQRDVRSASCFC